MSKRKTTDWKNRIVEYGEQPANQYLAHELNARRHPGKQREALLGSLNEVGWVAPVIVSARTGKLLDGHARVDQAILRGVNTPVPFVKVDVTEEEERVILASYDAITGLAEYDDKMFKELVQGIKESEVESNLMEMLKKLDKPKELAEIEESIQSESSSNQIYQLKDDVKFESSNDLEFPDLIPEMIPLIPLDLKTWAHKRSEPSSSYLCVYQNVSQAGLDRSSSILAFYTYDSKFEHVWYDPAKNAQIFLDEKWRAIVAPNFSLWTIQPRITQMWQVFRSRWVARYYQAVGISVVPDIDWIDDRSFDFNLLGIPVGCNSVSIQCQTKLTSSTEYENRTRGIKRIVEEIQPKQLLVYGALEDWKIRIAREVGKFVEIVHVQSVNQRLNAAHKERKKK